MKIRDILTQQLVLPALEPPDKSGTLRDIAGHICANTSGLGNHALPVFNALVHREQLGSTGVGEGVAIPHAKIQGLGHLVACFARVPKGVAFDAIDSQPVFLVFALLVPENCAGAHLKALARVSRLLKDAAFRAALMQCENETDLYQTFMREDDRY